jgi:hypothetical protein
MDEVVWRKGMSIDSRKTSVRNGTYDYEIVRERYRE